MLWALGYTVYSCRIEKFMMHQSEPPKVKKKRDDFVDFFSGIHLSCIPEQLT